MECPQCVTWHDRPKIKWRYDRGRHFLEGCLGLSAAIALFMLSFGAEWLGLVQETDELGAGLKPLAFWLLVTLAAISLVIWVWSLIPQSKLYGHRFILFLDQEGRSHMHASKGNPEFIPPEKEQMGIHLSFSPITHWHFDRLWLEVTTGGWLKGPRATVKGYHPWPLCMADTLRYRRSSAKESFAKILAKSLGFYYDMDHWSAKIDEEGVITLDAGKGVTKSGDYGDLLRLLQQYRGKWEYRNRLSPQVLLAQSTD